MLMLKVTPPSGQASPAVPNTNTAALSCSPCHSALPNDSACDEVSVEAAGHEAVGGRGPAGKETQGAYCEGDPGSAVQVRSIWLGSAGHWEGLNDRSRSLNDRLVDERDDGAVDLDIGGHRT
jgi:hypothetical protein